MSVFIGSIPNNRKSDVLLAKEIITGKIDSFGSRDTLNNKFQDIWTDKEIFLFNRGRDSMHFLLENIGLREGDEIIIQGFTCVAVLSPILWNKCKPVFVDIDRNTFNMDLNRLKESITERTRVIVIQHTFGNLADIKLVKEIVDKINCSRASNNRLIILEDCAHTFNLGDKRIGQYSDAFFFSFAQDKSISSTQGSLLVVNSKFFTKNLSNQYKLVNEQPVEEAMYNARYIELWEKIKNLYFTLEIPFLRFSVGKALLLLYRFLGFIRKQASSGTVNFTGIQKLSDIQAKLLLKQLESVKELNKHRESIKRVYDSKLNRSLKNNLASSILLRYPLLVKNPEEVIKELRHIKVIAGRWYSTPVFPISWNNLESVGYRIGTLPETEFVCRHILNLPLNVEMDEECAENVVEILNKVAIPL